MPLSHHPRIFICYQHPLCPSVYLYVSLCAPQLVLSCPTTVLPSPLPCLTLLQPGPQVTLLMPPSLEGQLGGWVLEGPPRHPCMAVG